MSVSSPDNGSFQSPFASMSSNASDHSGRNSLRPNSIQRVPSTNLNLMSPSDIVGPSPVTSTGTETTEIEDEEAEEVQARPNVTNPAPHPQVSLFNAMPKAGSVTDHI
ncbi:hypothetical protein COL5a_009323 [Colletotrichum fioriniae]|nr:hypothetical protein COL5a_009323 [Colletotrichum fioriniae]